jgi:threonylcarbamoyladenosine tRNA methylthiotransferase MtaB
MLRVLSAKKKRQFYEQQKGSQRMVLFESENKDGFMYGFTENYVRVKTPFNEQWINQLKPTTLNTIDEDGIYIFESD